MVESKIMPINENKGIYIEVDNELDTPRVFISLIDIKRDVVYQDLCGVRVLEDDNGKHEYEVYAFGDEDDEDATDIFYVNDNEGKYI